MVYSFLLTFFAGFSTLLGYFFIFIKSKNINRFISYCLSLVIGVMLSLSVFELILQISPNFAASNASVPNLWLSMS